jgi:RNA polymerase sigma-70 factor (ECF subfamily)
VLETSPVSVDSALQRAHKTVDERLPTQTQQRTLRLIADDELGALVERYVAAWEQNDVDAVVAMLSEDAKMAMPPLPSWYSGRDAIADFLRRYPLSDDHRWKMLPTSANGQPALAGYIWDGDADAFVPNCLSVLTLRDKQIEEVMAFLTPEAFVRFELPASITA